MICLFIQSGSLHTDWGWNLTPNKIKALADGAKQRLSCNMEESVYKCLANTAPWDIFGVFDLFDPKAPKPTIPTDDNDFFPEDISSESYLLSQR